MSRKRLGWRAAERTYNYLTRELAKKARDSWLDECKAALRLCYEEVRQFHSYAYPECSGGCPAHEAMAAAERFFGPKTVEAPGSVEPPKPTLESQHEASFRHEEAERLDLGRELR